MTIQPNSFVRQHPRLCKPSNRRVRSTVSSAATATATATAQQQPIVILGAGAAGLTAAYFAATSGAHNNVLVIEKNDEAGKKILISGGTRCNVLPQLIDVESSYFTESSSSALRAIFSSWNADSCKDWLMQDVGLKLSLEEETAKWFPTSNSAREVRDSLVAACIKNGVKFQTQAALTDLQRQDGDTSSGGWVCSVKTPKGEKQILADKVVLATGGKSFPTLGTDGIGYRLVKNLGHSLHEPYPALTPLLGTHPASQQLAGVSAYNIQLSVQHQLDAATGKKNRSKAGRNKRKSQEAHRSALLCTHRGFSGPAILDLSHYYIMAKERGLPEPTLSVNWLREFQAAEWEDLIKTTNGTTTVFSLLKRQPALPARLAEALCQEANVPLDRKLSELRKPERIDLIAVLTAYKLSINGHESYPKAEVTGGGVPLEEIHCNTMESRIEANRGLYLCGELVDIHGRIGGYNFYSSWVTGRLAGMAAAKEEI